MAFLSAVGWVGISKVILPLWILTNTVFRHNPTTTIIKLKVWYLLQYLPHDMSHTVIQFYISRRALGFESVEIFFFFSYCKHCRFKHTFSHLIKVCIIRHVSYVMSYLHITPQKSYHPPVSHIWQKLAWFSMITYSHVELRFGKEKHGSRGIQKQKWHQIFLFCHKNFHLPQLRYEMFCVVINRK